MKSQMRPFRDIAFLSIFGLLTVSCDQITQTSLPGADTFCTAGTAQIAIGDGYQEILCGCAEQGGQVITAGNGQLTCTVSVGTQVILYFQATQLTHQLIPANGSQFPASAISIPTADKPALVHAFQATTAGDYAYADAFNPGVFGQIIAH